MTQEYKYLLLTIFILLSIVTVAQAKWSFELHGGLATNLRLPLIIKQSGYPDIVIKRAHFESEPLISPWYWNWRFSKWFDDQCITFEAIHHKLYLVNKPTEVQRFGISHGFNMLLLNYGKSIDKNFVVRAGIGSVLLHPESTIRGMAYPEGPGFDFKGYVLRGVVINVAIAKQFLISKYFFVNTEGKITAAVVNAPVVNGHARVYNVAFQLILGLGCNLPAIII